ncbi:MAG: hypothetical protein H0X49_05635 [Acidobacteria bacterium]|nr:hypothetical protein [Acidobacteriota bacterium]
MIKNDGQTILVVDDVGETLDRGISHDSETRFARLAQLKGLKPHEREKSSIGFIATALQSDAPPFACSGRYA